ncbi:MAG: hypothetical protein RLY30_1266 [Pseudomonadota bacterium]
MLLSHLGWKARAFGRADRFFSALRSTRFDVILLDLHLPDLSARRLLDKLPEDCLRRTLVLTGRTDDWIVEESFSRGLADFLVKPCRLLELKCRIQRTLERECELTSDRQLATSIGPLLSALTHKERLCAEYLAARANTVVPREELLWEIWKLDERISSRRVDTYVSRIRQKLALLGDTGSQLVSIYGCGYRWETR